MVSSGPNYDAVTLLARKTRVDIAISYTRGHPGSITACETVRHGGALNEFTG